MKKNKELFAYILIIIISILSIVGVSRLFTTTKPNQSEPSFYKVYEDQFVRLYLSYSENVNIAEDGKTFVSVRGKKSNDFMLIIENLRVDGLIFTPTPRVTILDVKGEVVKSLQPFIFVAGLAKPKDSTYISFTNPIPPSNLNLGKYLYVIDLQYQYVFYDKVANTGDISINIGLEIIRQPLLFEFIYFIKRFLYVLVFLLIVLLFLRGRKR
ncbi:hypothetical protein [Anaerobranca gottschalkii]|uniref:Uncharacterized protein n=1 Tax=Anaerobranca gottschalkii DSM 13577 TaxID=1120990 RepID=A0A1I0CLW1_9FIRM|nr:hypothetical protein [Anaerobranca gottschalkii]SET20564.1 hypothetical protein SAMN03080614_10817 [Anaerobranca gottschalkii DSM 13577]